MTSVESYIADLKHTYGTHAKLPRVMPYRDSLALVEDVEVIDQIPGLTNWILLALTANRLTNNTISPDHLDQVETLMYQVIDRLTLCLPEMKTALAADYQSFIPGQRLFEIMATTVGQDALNKIHLSMTVLSEGRDSLECDPVPAEVLPGIIDTLDECFGDIICVIPAMTDIYNLSDIVNLIFAQMLIGHFF